MDIKDREEKILKFWKKDKTFEKSLEKTKKGKSYIFYDGPPFATGLPHYGHILGSVAKDIFGRFRTMKGRYVRRVWGWDCHGLPIENITEKKLKINSKKEIEKMGVKKFNSYCRSKVLEFADSWEEFVERIGRWVDVKDCYKTMDNNYIESVWWAFKKLWDKNYIYQGEKILMYCPRCSTPLAKAEIAMDNSYKNIKENSVVVKFKLKNENAYALSWTTTPWTLPSNLALTVNPELNYVYVKDNTNDETYIMCKDVILNFFSNSKDYKIIKEVKGKDLKGKEYEPLFDYFKNNANSFKILTGNFVTNEEGTGIVHTAPAFGEEDYEICKSNQIKIVQPIDERGNFTSEVKDFAGEYVHNSNEKIIEFLKKKNKVVLVKKIEHEYPFCYRCETKLIYRAIPSWFINIQKVKPRILELSKKIKWYPDFLKEGRVKHTIETAPDWTISRNRYWATAIPIWISEDGEKLVIGSIDELKKYAKNLPKKEIDLHKDFLDEIILEKDGKKFKRIPEVLDCWFESGAMPFAQFHYPFENKKEFETNFPSQFVAEYIAQIRAWFYYMLVLSVILFDEIPFENVVTTGTILAQDGSKMSKSKGNFTEPKILIEKFGVDALRFYLMSSPVMNADNINFSDKGVEEIYKKVILISYNTLKFYELNKIKSFSKLNSKNITDQWILSRLNDFGVKMENNLKNYNTIKSCNEIREFIDDLSTWYIRLNRERILKEKTPKEILKFVLINFSKAIAPIIPFISEEIYMTINENKKSVHLEDYPKFDKKKIDKVILKDMVFVREIVSSALRERDKIQIGLKWPLRSATVTCSKKLDLDFLDLIKEEINVKEIKFRKSKNKEIFVNLDTKITPELETEGYAREISRQVQAFRKKLGLEKKNKIELYIKCDENLKNIFEKEKDFIKTRTNSSKLDFVTSHKETFKNKTDFRIKDKRGEIGVVIK